MSININIMLFNITRCAQGLTPLMEASIGGFRFCVKVLPITNYHLITGQDAKNGNSERRLTAFDSKFKDKHLPAGSDRLQST